MHEPTDFDVMAFLPYVLNQAADRLSLEFQHTYKGKYGMLRTEWRVLFHLGRYGAMTAKEICDKAGLHKTKVSRAVSALEDKRFLERHALEHDRRHAVLSLTREGGRVFADLGRDAQAFDAQIRAQMSPEEAHVLQTCIMRIAGMSSHATPNTQSPNVARSKRP